jgi:glycogen synthase kinase 3 beta
MEKENNINNESINENDIIIDKKNIIGSGAFGEVYLAKIKQTGKKIAVKKVFQDERYKNRELSIMKELKHPNIVELLSYFYTKSKNGGLYLNCLMDYVPQTLSNLINYNKHNNKKFPLILIKLFSFQMLKSIGYLTSIGICHRDIKPQNILLDPEDYTLKLCDFGCAKHLKKGEQNISYICSRYYRPPELILGAIEYTTQVDVWSMGCVIAELVTNKPIFQGKSAEDQLFEIMNILGTPTKSQILELNPKIKEKIKLPHRNRIDWKDYFGNKINNDEYIDLVSKLLVYEPTLRLSPYEALCHPFFDELRIPDLKLPNGKKLPKHLFEFKTCEINFDKENIDFLLSQITK